MWPRGRRSEVAVETAAGSTGAASDVPVDPETETGRPIPSFELAATRITALASSRRPRVMNASSSGVHAEVGRFERRSKTSGSVAHRVKVSQGSYSGAFPWIAAS